MGTFTERIRLVLDADSTGATKGLGGFRQSVAGADGVMGKFKAGASSAMASVGISAGAMAAAAGVALVAFGVKAVGAFTDTAKAAIDMGAATGLAVEDASRWIGVGDDFEISAETLTTSIGKISKSLDATKWDKYGIDTRNAGGEARSANDILIDSLATLGEIENKTERARVGNELFGKGYASLAPMVGKTRDEYEKMLGAVEDGQVITAEEAEKAERMRLAQDALSDALHEVTLAVGEMVAGGAPALKWVADMTTKVADLVAIATGGDAKSMSEPVTAMTKAVKGLGDGDADIAKLLNAFSSLVHSSGDARSSIDKTGAVWNAFTNELINEVDGKVTGHLDNMKKAFGELAAQSPADAEKVFYALSDIVNSAALGNEKAQEFVKEWSLTSPVMQELADTLTTATTPSMDDATDAAGDLTAASKAVASSFEGMTNSAGLANLELQALKGQIDDDQAWLNMLDTLDAYKAKQDDATATDREKVQAGLAVQEELLGRLEAINGLPKEKQTEIITLINQADYDAAAYAIGVLTAARKIVVGFDVNGRPGPYGPVKAFAKGTNSAARGLAVLGEDGPELVGRNGPELRMMAGGETVLTAGQTRSALAGGSSRGNTYVTINAANMSGEQIAQALANWERRNGRR